MSTSHDNRIVDLINFLLSIAGMLQIKIIQITGKPVRVLICSGKKSNEQAFLFGEAILAHVPSFYLVHVGSTPTFSTIQSNNANHSLSVHSAISKQSGNGHNIREIAEPNSKETGCSQFLHSVFFHVCTLPFLTRLKPLTS